MTATIYHVDFSTGRLEGVETTSGLFTRIDEAPAPETKPAPASFSPRYCDPTNEIRGSNYGTTQRLDIADIAKMVRADIKAAKKAGKLPKKGLKTSVRIGRYSGGQSLDITVKTVPFQVLNPEWLVWEASDEGQYGCGPAGLDRYTSKAQKTLDLLKGILQSYNRDNSDSMSDYFDVRFYGDVRFDSDLTRAERAAFRSTN